MLSKQSWWQTDHMLTRADDTLGMYLPMLMMTYLAHVNQSTGHISTKPNDDTLCIYINQNWWWNTGHICQPKLMMTHLASIYQSWWHKGIYQQKLMKTHWAFINKSWWWHTGHTSTKTDDDTLDIHQSMMMTHLAYINKSWWHTGHISTKPNDDILGIHQPTWWHTGHTSTNADDTLGIN